MASNTVERNILAMRAARSLVIGGRKPSREEKMEAVASWQSAHFDRGETDEEIKERVKIGMLELLNLMIGEYIARARALAPAVSTPPSPCPTS